MIGALIFIITFLIVRKVRDGNDVKKWLMDGFITLVAYICLGLVVFSIQALFVSPIQIYHEQNATITNILKSTGITIKSLQQEIRGLNWSNSTYSGQAQLYAEMIHLEGKDDI